MIGFNRNPVVKAKVRVTAAQKKLCAAEEAMEEAIESDIQKHSPSEETKRRILALYQEGKPLCCKDGRKNLRDTGLSPGWVERLNEWAYDALGCSPNWKPGGNYYDRGLGKLKEKLAKMPEVRR